MTKDVFIKNIKASSKAIPCDLVIKNINVIDVFQCETFTCDVGISNGYIVGLGNYSGTTEIDGTNKYMCPSLIDAHCHIESSMLTPLEYYKVALLHGITAVIADPHEIANVLGNDGINLMLDLSKNIPFDFYFMLPSCVPATTFENSGATLKASDLHDFYNNPRVLGLGEVMDYVSVLNCNEDMMDKLFDSISNNKVIDGHGAGLNSDFLNSYACANIKTDHECVTATEVKERLRRGMYALLREGTAAKNLDDLIDFITPYNHSRLCLCSDDKHIDDFYNNGTIDYSIRKLINNGIKPEFAIKMGSYNIAQCYNIKNIGAIAPGFIADFLILDDLNTFKINSVYKNGISVVHNDNLHDIHENTNSNIELSSTINIKPISKEDFIISLEGKKTINAIGIIPNKLETKHLTFNIDDLKLSDKFSSITKDLDLIKIAVIERHNATGNIGLGILSGLNLKSGAIATTIAHDSHNIIVCGVNDEDMVLAINEIKNIGGGITVVNDGKVLYSLPLEIGGLITSKPASTVISQLKELHKAVNVLSPNLEFNPFLTLSFLSLPVIPDIKITDKGLFDVTKFTFIPVAE